MQVHTLVALWQGLDPNLGPAGQGYAPQAHVGFGLIACCWGVVWDGASCTCTLRQGPSAAAAVHVRQWMVRGQAACVPGIFFSYTHLPLLGAVHQPPWSAQCEAAWNGCAATQSDWPWGHGLNVVLVVMVQTSTHAALVAPHADVTSCWACHC